MARKFKVLECFERKNLPTAQDYKLIKCQTELSEKGSYDVIGVLDNSSKIRGTYLIKHSLNVAIKSVEQEKNYKQNFHRDIEVCKILARQPSANVVKIYYVQEYLAKDSNVPKAYIIMEKAKETLLNQRQAPIHKKLKWIGDAVKGLEYMHKCGIVHRDIKAENVVITYGGVGKILDFGASKNYSRSKEGTQLNYEISKEDKKQFKKGGVMNTKHAIGTTAINPPEINMMDDIKTTSIGSCDMWQFAVMIVMLLWNVNSQQEFRIDENEYDRCKDQWINNPKSELKLKLPPLKNPGIPNWEIFVSLVQRCLYYHPDMRISSAEFVRQFFKNVLNVKNSIDKSIDKSSAQSLDESKVPGNPDANRSSLRDFMKKCVEKFSSESEGSMERRMEELMKAAKEQNLNEKKARRLIEATAKLIHK